MYVCKILNAIYDDIILFHFSTFFSFQKCNSSTFKRFIQAFLRSQFDSRGATKIAITIFFFDELTKGVDFQMAFYVPFGMASFANLIVKGVSSVF